MAEAKKENFFVRTGKRLSRWFREMKSELKKVCLLYTSDAADD